MLSKLLHFIPIDQSDSQILDFMYLKRLVKSFFNRAWRKWRSLTLPEINQTITYRVVGLSQREYWDRFWEKAYLKPLLYSPKVNSDVGTLNLLSSGSTEVYFRIWNILNPIQLESKNILEPGVDSFFLVLYNERDLSKYKSVFSQFSGFATNHTGKISQLPFLLFYSDIQEEIIQEFLASLKIPENLLIRHIVVPHLLLRESDFSAIMEQFQMLAEWFYVRDVLELEVD